MNKEWLVIINPKSGNGKALKKWNLIKTELQNQKFKFTYTFTKYHKHAIKIIEQAVKHNISKFICVGGDGSLHHIVNGLMIHQKTINLHAIKLGIIPVGTGNDWIKTYGISKDIKEAISIIKKEKTFLQDIGKITLLKSNKTVYFNNIAGIGFDAFVVKNVQHFKKFGFIAYLISSLLSIIFYKRSNLKIKFNNTTLNKKSIVLLFGIGKFSGGGMQLTKFKTANSGFLEITYLDHLNIFMLLKHINKLFVGKVTDLSFVKTFKSASIKVEINSNITTTYIQTDGELIDSENFKVTIEPKALPFIIK